MYQAERYFEELAVAYAQPAFNNEAIKSVVPPIMAEAYGNLTLFANRPGDKLPPDSQIPMNAIGMEQLAVGLAFGYNERV
jgi:hypothetical protein